MIVKKRPLVVQKFTGARFEDGALDIDVLGELLAYKELLVETAKELWRRKNPERRRLPGKFEESVVLKFSQLEKGSVAVPIYREQLVEEQGDLFDEEDEVDEAANLIARTIDAAASESLLPAEFPLRLLEKFEGYGKSLRADEAIEHRTARSATTARYTNTVRERLVSGATRPYEDFVDAVGTVTMARVNRPRMAIALNNGPEVEAPFTADQEDTILTALREHASAKVRVRGRGVFVNGNLTKMTEVNDVVLLPAGEVPFDPNAKPIWEVFQEILRDAPPESFALLPRDGAEYHDHYLYGIPKAEL